MLVTVVEISNSNVHKCTSNQYELKAQLQTTLRSDLFSNVGSVCRHKEVISLIWTSKVSELRQPVWDSGWTSLKSSSLSTLQHCVGVSVIVSIGLDVKTDSYIFLLINLPMTIIIPPTAAVTDEASGHRDFLLESPSNTTAAADTHMNVSAVVH